MDPDEIVPEGAIGPADSEPSPEPPPTEDLPDDPVEDTSPTSDWIEEGDLFDSDIQADDNES